MSEDDAQFALPFEPHRLAHKHDPMTSRDAAFVSDAFRGRHHQSIIASLTVPMTSEEIADATGLDYHAVARRMGELRDAGFVIQTPEHRRNRSGRMAVIWRKARTAITTNGGAAMRRDAGCREYRERLTAVVSRCRDQLGRELGGFGLVNLLLDQDLCENVDEAQRITTVCALCGLPILVWEECLRCVSE